MDSIHEFLQWEKASRDTIDFKKIYVDVAGEDLVAGLLLSQIIYWWLPGQDGRTKLRVKKDDMMWLAKGREDWWDEIRITAKQYDRAIKILEDEGLIEKKLFKFDGAPMVHIHLFVHTVMERVKSILTKGENPIIPKVKMDIDETVNSLTETTSETTSKSKEITAPQKPEESSPQQPISFTKSSMLLENFKKVDKDFCTWHDTLVNGVKVNFDKKVEILIGSLGVERIRNALEKVRNDEWLEDRGLNNLFYLLDTDRTGERAHKRIVQYSKESEIESITVI